MNKILFIALVALSFNAQAWDGIDESGNDIAIEKNNLVRKGKEIEYFNYGTGEYNQGEVQSVRKYGGRTEVEIYDYNAGEYKTLEMDR